VKIKAKLTLGVGVLFVLIILLSVVGAKCINDLKTDSEIILVANYNSLEYCHNMLVALDENSQESQENFEANLKNQENNITEIGEKESTSELRSNFNIYRRDHERQDLKLNIRKEIFRIMEMNMQAIQRKSELAKATAEGAFFWIAITGTSCFLIAFILLVNLPSNIANPIKEMTESIKQIAAENYSQRVHFESHSEFGQLANSFNTMAEKLEEFNNSNLAKLMMEKRRIEMLINKMHDPVIGLDENLNVIFANEEGIKISGLDSADLIGKNAKDLAVSNDLIRSLIRDLFVDEVEPGKKYPLIKIFSENKESYFEKETLNISITATGESKEILVGHVIFLRNITTYKELDFAKTNFIATISHEFKTPISSIKMSLQLLDNESIGKLNEEQKNLIDSIKDDANRLLKITAELLNMTQVESGNIQLSIFAADPKEILQYAIDANKTQADMKQIVFDTKFAETLMNVMADKEKTAWVLTNLISNAIRYSYDQAVIYLAIEQTEQQVRFLVRDTGQGIAPQYMSKVFDRYFRVPGTNPEGTGLGLAICKELIEAQGGSIAVQSEYGSGSTFIISLNRA
jgi:PAS domain S-box-containing protein